jgi:hypothetical protein
MDRRLDRHHRRRHLQVVVRRASGPAVPCCPWSDCMQSDQGQQKNPSQHSTRHHQRPFGPCLSTKRLIRTTRCCVDVRMARNSHSPAACPDETFESAGVAREPIRRPLDMRCSLRLPRKARVYPKRGLFLKLTPFSNIKAYLPVLKRTGAMSRSLLLRSSPGTSLTMQPNSNHAQSLYTRPPPHGKGARSPR